MSNNYETITIIHSSCGIGGQVVPRRRTCSTSWITCILQNEASPLQSRDIGIWSFAFALKQSVQMAGKIQRAISQNLIVSFNWNFYHQQRLPSAISCWNVGGNMSTRFWEEGSISKFAPISPKRGYYLGVDPEIDRVDLWRSIWGKCRSTRSIDSTFGPSHDSARLSATAIDSIDFILDFYVFA